MKRYLEIKGIEIIDENGEGAAVVHDIIFNKKNFMICSLVVIMKKVLTTYGIIPFKNIKSIEKSIVFLGELNTIGKETYENIIPLTLERIIGMSIVDYSGEKAGDAVDIIIDEFTGEIKAFVATRGIVDDLVEGRRVFVIDEDTVIDEKIRIRKNSIEMINEASIKRFLKG